MFQKWGHILRDWNQSLQLVSQHWLLQGQLLRPDRVPQRVPMGVQHLVPVQGDGLVQRQEPDADSWKFWAMNIRNHHILYI